MDVEPSLEDVEMFLSRVMEIEDKYAFSKKGRDTDRKEELRSLLEKMCK